MRPEYPLLFRFGIQVIPLKMSGLRCGNNLTIRGIFNGTVIPLKMSGLRCGQIPASAA